MAYALQQLINGISLGMIYGLIAVGYTMVYGIIGMINFAHGDVFMIGAFISLIAVLLLRRGRDDGGRRRSCWCCWSRWPSPRSMAGRSSVSPIARCAASFRLAPLIRAIGMSIVLQNYVQVSQGARVKPMRPLVPGGFKVMRDGGFVVQFSYMQMLIIVVTLGVLAVFTMLVARTPLGRAMRACEQDMKMAALLGIDTDRTISLTFVIGAALAAVAGTAVHAPLRRDRFLHRLPGRGEGLHRRGAGRHRLAARGGARRLADRPDRDLLVGLFQRRSTRMSPPSPSW